MIVKKVLVKWSFVMIGSEGEIVDESYLLLWESVWDSLLLDNFIWFMVVNVK